jgi:sugar (pentulose or hexulose) kinase
MKPQFVGFDLGTSGARISIIERSRLSIPTSESGGPLPSPPPFQEVYSQAIAWKDCGAYDDATSWMVAIERLAHDAARTLPNGLSCVVSICVSGTSASCLMVDRNTLTVTRKPRMYDYDIASGSSIKVHALEALDLLDRHCPPRHTSRARTGSLAKLLSWARESLLQESEVFLHQSDYVSLLLMQQEMHPGSKPSGTGSVDYVQQRVHSDWHNCLKLGYDVRNDCWPDWLDACLQDAGIANPFENSGVVPLQVHSPGTPMGTMSRYMAQRLGLREDTMLVGGTTDSNAAFFAAAGVEPELGTAVTSLGSTMAIKLLSAQYVEDADRGVYSHRFPTLSTTNGDNRQVDNNEAWLVGGASNVGCAIFRALNFTNAELEALSIQLDPMVDSPHANYYYPLCKVGERFPKADPNKVPILEPVPENRQEYLHGLLQSMSYVEREGFQVLHELGAPLPTIVWTCGGGSRNDAWSHIRQRILRRSFESPGGEITVRKATNTEASFGAALLAASICPSGYE